MEVRNSQWQPKSVSKIIEREPFPVRVGVYTEVG